MALMLCGAALSFAMHPDEPLIEDSSPEMPIAAAGLVTGQR